MANHLKTIVKKKNGIIKFKIVVEKLQKSLLLGKKLGSDKVKEGHFAVIAVEEDEHKRFVIPLTYLNHPSFLRLLDQAAEEYGFDHKGALTIPCQPCELERMLEDREIGSPVKPS